MCSSLPLDSGWSQSEFLPIRLPASACLLLSWLSAYLNLLMKTYFTVQSTDGSSSLPKESRLASWESKLPPRDGWLGNGRTKSEESMSGRRCRSQGWGLGTAGLLPGQGPSPVLAPGLQVLLRCSAIWVNEDDRP